MTKPRTEAAGIAVVAVMIVATVAATVQPFQIQQQRHKGA